MVKFNLVKLTDESPYLSKFVEIRNNSIDFLHDQRTFTVIDVWEYLKSNPPTEYYLIFMYNEPKILHEDIIGYVRMNYNTHEIGMDLDIPYRDKGLGTKIYQQILPDFAAKTGGNLYLRVLKFNHRAIHLYKKLGFKIIEQTDIDYKMKYIYNDI